MATTGRAAHSARLSMALSHALSQARSEPESLDAAPAGA